MKILFDMYKCEKGKFDGGSEYIYSVFYRLVNNYADKCELAVVKNASKDIEDFVGRLIVERDISIYNIREIREVGEICKREKFNVFYSGLPYDYREEDLSSETVNIGTFHGMREIECPEDMYSYKYSDKECIKHILGRYFLSNQHYEKTAELIRNKKCNKMEIALKAFQRIVTVSNTSKYSITRLFPQIVADKNIFVFYSAPKQSAKVNLAEDKGYILLTMASRWRKNAYRAMRAIANLKEKGLLKDVRVVVTGNASEQIVKEFDKFEFDFEGYVSTERLEELYAQCHIYVFPSLNEGFGYTPVEAMKYGKTCVCSCMTSIPEVCGNGVYYFNPLDIGDIETKILYAWDTPIEERLIADNYQRVSNKMNKDLDELCKFIYSSGHSGCE